jgi:hypothetical protein
VQFAFLSVCPPVSLFSRGIFLFVTHSEEGAIKAGAAVRTASPVTAESPIWLSAQMLVFRDRLPAPTAINASLESRTDPCISSIFVPEDF